MTVTFDENKQNKKFEELRQKEEEQVAEILSGKYGIKYVDLTGIAINSDALRIIKEEDARKGFCAAFKIVGKKLSIAVYSPEKNETKAVIESLKDKEYIPELYM